MNPEIVALGHIVNETIRFPDRVIAPVLGSPVAYSMVCAARLGARVGIVTHIGSDFPEELLTPFHQAGVDLTGVMREGGSSTCSELIYDESGEKVILYPSRAPLVAFEDIPPAYHSARLFYVCTMDWDVPLQTIRRLKDLGGVRAADLGGYGGAHVAPGREPIWKSDPETIRELIGCFHIVKASDEDCRKMTGDPEIDTKALAREFLDCGAEAAVITMGPQGAWVASREEEHYIPPLPGNPVDQTGGGDTYMAGFLVGYLRTGSLREAGFLGAVTALIVIEGTGGVRAERMPTWAMAQERLAQGRQELRVEREN